MKQPHWLPLVITAVLTTITIAAQRNSTEASQQSALPNLPQIAVPPFYTSLPLDRLIPLEFTPSAATPDGTDRRSVRIFPPIPFTAQAPNGDWDDPYLHDGCEEASALMAIAWARGETLSPPEALAGIRGAAEYTELIHGEYRDTSAADTLDWIIRGRFEFDNAALVTDLTLSDLTDLPLTGLILIVPVDGQKLGNPHYKAPGPPQHMLVVHGYDADTDEFVTHDPGTRFGADYRYDASVFYAAMRDYPTGEHGSMEPVEKNVIAVWPESL